MTQWSDNSDGKFKSNLDAAKKEKRLGIHSFHRYYGKLIPAIPRTAIRMFTGEGDLIFDPFAGSGTTAVEALALGRRFAGVEINPLSVMIARIKTASYDFELLHRAEANILELLEKDREPVAESEKPFCVNREHWFKEEVVDDLVRIYRNIPRAVAFIGEGRKKYEEFLLGVLSAIIKQVSNADTGHVFPGISKRMRRLESEGKIKICVDETFRRALKRRIAAAAEFSSRGGAVIMNGNSASIDLAPYEGQVDLIVTNPPYISSVRYAETLKLELYMMGICRSAREYVALADAMIGSDHIKASEHRDKFLTAYDGVNEYIERLYATDTKQAKVVYDYFSRMEKVIVSACRVLKPHKKAVIKISDSKIRKIAVPTGRLLTEIAEKNGFVLVDKFDDKISDSSRSLLTARNTYSDIIVEDNIVIWEKK